MSSRIDYLDDPAAPPPTGLVPSANVVVVDEGGRILLIRRRDNDNWAVPGGAMDLGETIVQAAVRETGEETGLDVEVTGLVGIYTNPGHVIEYTSDGEVRQEFSVVFTARPTGGRLATSQETSEVAWIEPTDLGELQMHPSMRLRLDHYLESRAHPYLG